MIKKTLKIQWCNNMRIQILMMNNIDNDVRYIFNYNQFINVVLYMLILNNF